MQIYLVGGAVRDSLLHYPVKERDWVVVGASVQQMLDLGYQQVGKDFPVFLHPETKEEYALARTERKTAAGYTGFAVHTTPDVSLEDDLLRRDLTINAIAQDGDGNIVDPFHGQQDLKHKLLRHVSPAFSEDPVRILRVARFAARYAHLGFSIAHDTMQLMSAMVAAGEVDALVAERIWQEMHKALDELNPEVFFTTLKQCGALHKILPELDCLFGIPQPEKHHPEIDTGLHSMMVLQQAVKLSKDASIRFAALVHDLGKGKTPESAWPSHHGHEEKGVKIIQTVCQRLRIPNSFRDLAVITSRYHLHVHRAFELKTTTLLKTLEGLDAIRKGERFENFLLACEADAKGRKGYENSDYPQADYFRQARELASNINISPLKEQQLAGKQMAEAISQLRLQALQDLKNSVSQ
ncbi:MAG: multifunctional CCA addition/repair protein [Gammaproteobacteria bacterium]|nr:multifunctional CCA addition/repair protein [Gammaproteobacteria bacterium]